MEISSVQMLCKHLIFCAVQRCRLRDDPCRLSVKLTPSPLLSPPLVRISVSDTGIGSKLEEYQHLKYPNDLVLAGKWDGLISISTTGISDNEMHHLNLNIKESVSSKRLTRLPSTTKNGAKFSGTEVSISTSESVDHLLEDLTFFFKKMLILKIPMVAVELLVDYSIMPGSHIESCILAIECGSLPLTTESITCLRSGLEDYVLKHGNKLNSICQSCFLTGENLKVGTGIASCLGNMQNNRLVMEAVIIISELSELATPSCFREHEMETEIFFLRDFVPCTAPQSSLDALKGISWKSYGLTLRTIKDQGGCALLEWENLPPSVHIDIVIHYYDKQLKALDTQIGQIDRSLTRKAVKLALDDLKEKNQGVLLSRHAQKICNYAPDLAKTIARLILSSNDLNFQGECCSLLGLQPRDMKMEAVECSIRERIVSVIGKNDQKPQRSRREAAELLFERPDLMEDEYHQELEDEVYNSFDLE
ncbi:type 2 DNA topoisomerase 6 subunit B-like [Ipomoea triloba]|uniref:type 2 DNA topoisomerase 6 subunit B-like n=1 Tax=Ipomoea triloba TaxID=35885 RepID=UPI00125DB34F|nr:type 2 DNA topoisomerase 6 subunit B-like [Ipomoea triloba]